MASEVSPDDVCLVCGTIRDQHGDKQHKFNNMDDQVHKLDPPPKPGREAPRSRSEAQLEEYQNGKAIASLLEVLLEKGVIDGKDTIRILMGHG